MTDIETIRQAVKDSFSLIRRYQIERGSVPVLFVQHLRNSGDFDELNLTNVFFEELLDGNEDLIVLLEEGSDEPGEPFGPCELGKEEARKPRTLAEKLTGQNPVGYSGREFG